MRIFDRPDLDQRAARLAMYITGSFANGKPAEAYEGRLQVHNGVGGMTVEQIDGDKLPNGTSLYMDGDEVVLSWPAYSATLAVIPNPGFESGDVSWTKGTGWSIGTENPIAGARSARYGENPGDALIENTARYPVNPGMPIEATCQVRQGASAEGNAGAAVQLQWRREDGSLLETSEGNAVMSASKNRVYPSTVVATPPAGAALVNVASRGIRRRENKPLFIDSFVWDHQQLTGVDAEVTYNLTLRVRDSAGQSAVWRGTVAVIDVRDYAVEVLADAPVAYWKLDDALGVTSYADSSGNGVALHKGSASPNSPVMQSGALRTGGQSARFDAISSLSCDPGDAGFASLAVSPDRKFSLECVVATPTWLGTSRAHFIRKTVYSFNTNFSNDYVLGFDSDGTFRLVFGWTNNGGGGSDRQIKAPFELEAGRIYHVLCTSDVDPDTDVCTVRMYINGELVTEASGGIFTSPPINSNNSLTINGQSNWGAWSFEGRVSDIAIYNSPLSAARALTHARAAGLA